MARLILTSPGEDAAIGGDVTVVGSRQGGEVITVTRGQIALDASFNAGGDTIVLANQANSYTARVAGSAVLIEGPDTSVTIPVGVAGMNVSFADGSLLLRVNAENGTVLLGGQVVTSAAQSIVPAISAAEITYSSIDDITIPFESYEGSVISRGVLMGADGSMTLIFGGPLYQDGFVDIPSPFQTLTITPSGELVSGPELPDGAQPVHPRIGLTADFNGDGADDFFSANHGHDVAPFPGETNTLLLSDGIGGYVEGAVPHYLDFTHSADVGDVDGDGDIDIYVGPSGGESGSRPYFLINDGTGSFTAVHDQLEENDQAAYLLLVSGKLVDIDGDDDLDLIVGGHGDTPNAGWIYFNDGDGNFAEQDGVTLPQGLFSEALTIDIQTIDIDNDGDMDLLLAQTRKDPFYGGGLVQVLENDGTGAFTDVTAQALPGQSSLPGDETDDAYITFIHTADINGDGYEDLFLSRTGPEEQLIWLNDGDGTFSALPTDQLGLSGVLLLPVDYNGDGVSELIAFSRDLSEGVDLTVQLYALSSIAEATSPLG